MKGRNASRIILSVYVGVMAMILVAYLSARRSRALNAATVVTDVYDLPRPILLTAMSEKAPWRSSLARWPQKALKMSGYTCAIWKWPSETWDSEMGKMSDEFRIWIKNDTAKVVSTPHFFRSRSHKAKPPPLTADKAIAIAKMKTGINYGVTNSVEDVGAFFKICFFLDVKFWKSSVEAFHVWVSKSDWSVCGNPFHPVQALTASEALSVISSEGRRPLYNERLPLKVDRVADLTILSLPRRRPCREGKTPSYVTYYWISFWIDNATRKVIGGSSDSNW